MPKSKNGSLEEQRLLWLVNNLNEKLNQKDKTLEESLKNKLNINMIEIECFKVAGGRGKHYDMTIHLKDGKRKTIEHKGITGLNKTGDDERPWNLTPQLVNATYNFSELSLMYCKLWWRCLFVIKKLFPGPILPEVPIYEDWIKDAKQGSVKTKWGKALKEIRKVNNNEEINHNKCLIDEVVNQSLLQFWTKIRDERQDLVESAKKTIEDMMCKCLREKDFWLNAFYEKGTDIEPKKLHWCVTPELSNLTCDVCLNENKKPLLNLTYNLSSNPTKKFNGKALLRWGNGKGIANVRWNLS